MGFAGAPSRSVMCGGAGEARHTLGSDHGPVAVADATFPGVCDVGCRGDGAWSCWPAHADATGTPPSQTSARLVAGGWTCSRRAVGGGLSELSACSDRDHSAPRCVHHGAEHANRFVATPLATSPPIEGCATWAVIYDFDGDGGGSRAGIRTSIHGVSGTALLCPWLLPCLCTVLAACHLWCRREGGTAYRAAPLSHVQGCTGISERCRTLSARISNRGCTGGSPDFSALTVLLTTDETMGFSHGRFSVFCTVGAQAIVLEDGNHLLRFEIRGITPVPTFGVGDMRFEYSERKSWWRPGGARARPRAPGNGRCRLPISFVHVEMLWATTIVPPTTGMQTKDTRIA